MQFIVLGYDGDDDAAPDRRAAARPAHLEAGRVLYEQGRWLYAAGILDEEGRLVGSMIVCDFPSREDLDEEWLDDEPYVLGGVWKRVEVRRAQVAPFCAPRPRGA